MISPDNGQMCYFFKCFVLVSGLLLGACSPSLNWRDVNPEQTPLRLLFPCKPDQGERSVPLGGKVVVMKMLGCEAGGATFTLGYADLTGVPDFGGGLDYWRRETLRQINAQTSRSTPFVISGAMAIPQSVVVEAHGVKADGSVVVVNVAWFAIGAFIYQAAVYSDGKSEKANPPMADTYFSGIGLK
jgi:hypothetical protein